MSSDTEQPIQVQVGGRSARVTLSSVGDQHEEPAPAEAELVRDVRHGTGTYNVGTDKFRSNSGTQVQVNGASLNIGEGILSTARSRWGGPANEIRPDTIVTIEGMDVEVKTAVAMGYLRKDAAGNFVEASARQAQAEAHDVATSGSVYAMKQEPFAPEVEGALIEAAGDVRGDVLVAVAAECARQFAETGQLATNVEDVMGKTGMSREAATEFTTKAANAFSQQANALLAQYGISDPQEFVDWALAERPREFKAAVQNHVGARTLNGYRELARDFMRNTVPDAEVLEQAGIPTMLDPTTKELLIKLEGTWIRATVAARTGRI